MIYVTVASFQSWLVVLTKKKVSCFTVLFVNFHSAYSWDSLNSAVINFSTVSIIPEFPKAQWEDVFWIYMYTVVKSHIKAFSCQ